ncbi:RnfABCDGE type electron transport complex subunit D [Engelhardtia mirabilis]|uniref:NQR2, RnfD, RnfE family n=1 Tax=Engelhardtia mirabilis TaxID=2528011 RepID=A0A518BRW6_9BACT|nr:NQR2, RnfD, RnfE family [Planctomycetes bacterium Pla133]QDV04041.1 NQR2, RnfD, RnfE family [Planctomycetes bacterium Pla86]
MTTAQPTLQQPRPSSPLQWAASLNPKWLITILITLILVVAQVSVDLLSDIWILPAALGAAVLTESVLSLALRGHLVSIQSAYISGISMTILTKPQQGLIWPFVLGAAISIASKYALTYRGRHLWNPTNFGISIMLLLAPGSVAVLSTQFDNSIWPLLVIWTVGLLVASRAKILHVTGAYLASFVALAGMRALLTGDSFVTELAPVTGPMYQLFLFFMITDPPTTVSTKRGRIAVAITIAVVECGIRLLDELPVETPLHVLLQAPPIFALAIVGPIAKVIDLRRKA